MDDLATREFLICQQNETEWEVIQVCAEWEVAADMPEEQTFSCTVPHAHRGSTILHSHVFLNYINFELHKHTAFKRQQNTSTKGKKLELEAPTQTVESGRKR